MYTVFVDVVDTVLVLVYTDLTGRVSTRNILNEGNHMTTLSVVQYQSLDPVAQHVYRANRISDLTRLWKCACGARLPRRGYIWASRFDKFTRGDGFFSTSVASCGYLCDNCADARESGTDY